MLIEQKRLYQRKIIKTKCEYINNKIITSDNACKIVWKLVNNEIKPMLEVKNDVKLTVNGKTETDPFVVCNIFNYHFIKVVDNYVKPNITYQPNDSFSTTFQNNPLHRFRIEPVTKSELLKIISSFKNKYSAGFDEVPLPIIKSAKHCLSEPLTHLINSSFITGLFPDKIKITKVVTVFKKGNSNDPNNYRPLSILPSFSKIFERAMHIRLMKFLEDNKLIDDEQYGFRSGKSVITAGIDFIESIVDAIDRGEYDTGMFMDLCKAFDSVSHDKLISTLSALGIVGIPLDWMGSYLKNRSQFVESSFKIHIINY